MFETLDLKQRKKTRSHITFQKVDYTDQTQGANIRVGLCRV